MVVLGPNRYGKAETRIVRVTRHGDAHRVKDLNVSTALSGDMDEVHLSGDNSAVLPTDSQKNAVYALAKRHGIGAIEDFALLLARHFADSQPTVRHARVAIEEYAWERNGASGHSFVRAGGEVRTCVAHYDGERAHVVSGLRDLVVLNTTNSEFWGYIKDEYTTLPETRDRMLATAVNVSWRHAAPAGPSEAWPSGDWDKAYDRARQALLAAFAETYSLSLQQTLYAMGSRVLGDCPGVCEVRLSLPNKHHFVVDLTPFGLDNDGEVYFAADRPYGLIEGTVLREDAPDAGPAWE
ncbi:factor-independent urate hydroxylase [Microbispora sp. ATCC PTA-5024]|uniref:factor-independent urate hydroxylase n=1 Tax=Microbispora sp. ATCC PTA-5024 TaxID=316330 RepID=UPI0003DD0B93|nr:urate oxidase [Microbispora sp. ATCC PTA-5024]ETK36334.1 urate oxidase [Microbispora sp. ATCC PTA-5024]